MSSTQNKIEFKLFAPYNEFVALIGSWNNWQKIDMQKGDDGFWRTHVPLPDGDYTYKFTVKSKSFFMVDQWASVTDPCVAQVTRDADENACLTVKNGQRIITSHVWQHDDVPLPANDQLVIYELHVGDFSGGPGDDQHGPKGRFQDVLDKLDYLSSLGINAIELMPCNEFPFERSWGYNPRSLFAVENNYGTPDDLCRLVDECHARGIRVIHDGVYNHTQDEAPLTKIDYTYWYHRENPDEPYNRFGPKFDYQHYDENLGLWPARQHVLEAVNFWIEHFHIDGIRFDATYLISHYEFLGWLNSEVRKLTGMKPFYTIAENLPQDSSITGPNGPLDAAWHETFSHQLTATILGTGHEGSDPYSIDGLIRVLDPRNDGFSGSFNVVNYIDNHDKERVMWRLGQRNIFDAAAFRRNKLGAALLLTAPGIPMVWMGQEFAESDPKTTDWQRLDWSLLQNPNNKDLMHFYSGLIHLRKNTPALCGNTFEVFFRDDQRGIIGFKRWDAAGGIVVVLANLKDSFAGEVQVGGWPGDGTWHEYRNNYDVQVSSGVLHDTLAESEVKIYLRPETLPQ